MNYHQLQFFRLFVIVHTVVCVLSLIVGYCFGKVLQMLFF